MTHLISFYTDVSDSSERHTATLKNDALTVRKDVIFTEIVVPFFFGRLTDFTVANEQIK